MVRWLNLIINAIFLVHVYSPDVIFYIRFFVVKKKDFVNKLSPDYSNLRQFPEAMSLGGDKNEKLSKSKLKQIYENITFRGNVSNFNVL